MDEETLRKIFQEELAKIFSSDGKAERRKFAQNLYDWVHKQDGIRVTDLIKKLEEGME